MRKSPRDEAARWLDQATIDLRWAQRLADEGGWHIACFLAQQVTEKALKAFLYSQGEEIVLGHSVARLCAAAQSFEAGFAERASRWTVLDGYYVATRYPNGLPDGIPAEVFTRDAAANAVALAREAVDWVRELLESGSGPSNAPPGS